jgi:carboxymethylenebutenolidase
VVVIQEWWGLNDQIKEVCDRFASDGFVALAPDLYRGQATTKEDEAGQMMMALNIEQAAKDMAGAADYLKGHDAASGSGVGVTGFCMGGGLALWLATLRPDDVKAVVPYYGVIPWPAAQPDYSKLQAPVQGHYAENDDFANPETVRKLEEELQGHGASVEFFIYPGCGHAFTNHHRPEVFHEDHSQTAWDRTIGFFRANL